MMDKKTLFFELAEDYRRRHSKAEKLYSRALNSLIRGGSHNLRLSAPFTLYDAECRGSRMTDIQGRTYIDFWQGHFANILGHNPEIITEALSRMFQDRQGLGTGFPGHCQVELAELILARTGAEKIRFTTSGTLATMYAIMLSKSFTKRELVLKIGGGWHGAQPYALKGISQYRKESLNSIESAGLPVNMETAIKITRFNSIEDLENTFRRHGNKLSCFIVEPFIGAGGFIFGDKDYLLRARELTEKYGTILIFDEVVSGFRFHAGALHSLYGIQPDLTVFGKVIGGGMPVSAVAGREEILKLCSPDAPEEQKVKFEGGTFSSHPAAMLAGLTCLRHLIDNEEKIYPRIGKFGELIRKSTERIFNENGFKVLCTGYGYDITEAASLVGVHFLKKDIEKITNPEQVWNDEVCDIDMRENIFKLAMLQEGVNIFHGFGAISDAHSENDILASIEAVERIAHKWKKKQLKY